MASKFQLPVSLLVKDNDTWGPTEANIAPTLKMGTLPFTSFDRAQPQNRPRWAKAAGRQIGNNWTVIANWYRDVKSETDAYENQGFMMKSDMIVGRKAFVNKNRLRKKARWHIKEVDDMREMANQVKAGRSFGANSVAKRSKWQRNRRTMNKYRQQNYRDRYAKTAKEPSIKLGSEESGFYQLKEWSFQDLEKEKCPVAQMTQTVLTSAGTLYRYKSAAERISKKAVRIKTYEKTRHICCTTSDDPIISRIATQNEGNVYITDVLLSTIMTCWRSNYGWDIMISKREDGMIIFDKRVSSRIDYLTVSENVTSSDAMPKKDEKTKKMNWPESLADEATIVNQRFGEQVIDRKKSCMKLAEANPYLDDILAGGQVAAPTGYYYKLFALPLSASMTGQTAIKVVCRCAVDGVDEQNKTLLIRAVNQYDPKRQRTRCWKKFLHTSKASIILDCMKCNAAKMGRWGAQALLGSVADVKLGYVVRVDPTVEKRHDIQGVVSYPTSKFLKLLKLSESTMWATFVSVVNQIRETEGDARFVLLKDPNRPCIRLYQVPDDFAEGYEPTIVEEENKEATF